MRVNVAPKLPTTHVRIQDKALMPNFPGPVGWTLVETIEGANEGDTDVDQVVTFTANLEEDDIVLIFATSDSAAFPTNGQYVQTADYQPLVRTIDSSMAHEIVYKIMGPAPDNDVTIRSPNVLHVGYSIQVWRGVDTANVLDGTVQSNILSTDVIGAPAIVTTEDNSLDIVVCFINEHDPGSTVSFTPNGAPPAAPVGFSNRTIVDALNTANQNGAGYVASRETDGGSHDAVVFDGATTSSARSMAQYRFALRNKIA